MLPWILYIYLFIYPTSQQELPKDHVFPFFVTVNYNDLEMRTRAAKTLKCRPFGFPLRLRWWRAWDSITMAIGVCEVATTVAGGEAGGGSL